MADFTPNSALACPHCGKRGKVQTRTVKRKAGISGGKAVAGILTGGMSLLVPGIGLSRREKGTEARCNFCGSQWGF